MSSYKGHGHELLPKSDKPAWAQWFRRKRGGVVVALVAVLAVLVLEFVSGPEPVAKLDDVATETGSVAEFWGEPAPNHAGNGIVFKQSTEQGVGVFLLQIPGGERKLVFEIPEKFADKNRTFQNLNVWSWSTDDAVFAFSYLDVSNRVLVVCNGKTGEREVETKVSRVIKDLVWLDASTVVYVNERDDLYYWGAGGDRRGSSPLSFVKKGAEKPAIKVSNLAVWSPDTVAWHDGSAVWRWQFGTERPVQVWDSATNSLLEFDVDSASGSLMLRFRDASGDSLGRYHIQSGRYESLGGLETLSIQTNRIVWLGGKSFAYARPGAVANTLRINVANQSQPLDLEFAGGMNSYVSIKESVYAVGSRQGEPVGIWRWSGKGSELSCVVSNPLATYQYSKPVAPAYDQFTATNGNKISYRLWSPPRMQPGKQYPLFIGRVSARWNGYPIALANAGFYVVSVEQDDEETCWSEEAMSVLEHVESSGARLDRKRMYLFGTSNHAWRATKVFDASPELWRGMVLFCPGGSGPAADRLEGRRLLIDCGADDRYTEYALKHRDELARRGVDITAVVHQDAEHIYRSIRTLRERDQAVMKFMFER